MEEEIDNNIVEEPLTDKRMVFRHIVLAILGLTLAAGILTPLIGLIAGCRTSLQFSNSYFIAGSILGMIGMASTFGKFGVRWKFDEKKIDPIRTVEISEKTKSWLEDAFKGYNPIVILVSSGLLLIGLSILVDKIFG
jgi:hypothetical protein